jgi:tRNA threonylcarbamoyl adenosine modification protein YeaZ
VHVLAFDTATESTAVAVVDFNGDGHPTIRAVRAHVDPRAHGERLAPQIVAALAEAGVGPAGLAAIVAGTGPGPFTGLRVGLVTAAAMGQALGIPTYGVCSLDGIGIGIGIGTGGRVLVATDARRREVYWAVYEAGVRVTAPAVDRPAEVRVQVERGYGDGAIRYREVLGIPVAQAPRYPDPAALAVLAYDRIAAGKPGEVLTPRYLRRPDATPR